MRRVATDATVESFPDFNFELEVTPSEEAVLKMLLSRGGKGCIISMRPKCECALFKSLLPCLVASNTIQIESNSDVERNQKEKLFQFDLLDELFGSSATLNLNWHFIKRPGDYGKKKKKEKKGRKGDFYYGAQASRKFDASDFAYDLNNLFSGQNHFAQHLIDNWKGNSTIWQCIYKDIETEVDTELEISKPKGKEI